MKNRRMEGLQQVSRKKRGKRGHEKVITVESGCGKGGDGFGGGRMRGELQGKEEGSVKKR